MRNRCVLLVLLVAVVGACGKEIGDSCIVNTDCSPNGDRECDNSSLGGYCTIQGCDFSTCPDEAACIRFFTGSFSNRPCDHDPNHPADPANPRSCSLDETCALNDQCVPRSSEVRYCMRTCGSDGDCRDDFDSASGTGYECRDLEMMISRGGEPVLAPGLQVDARSPKFCAEGPRVP